MGFAGGILAVENVAGNEYDIHLTLCDNLYKLIEDGEMLLPSGPGWGIDVNEAAVRSKIGEWELAWTRQNNRYSTQPRGDAVSLSRACFEKYSPEMMPLMASKNEPPLSKAAK